MTTETEVQAPSPYVRFTEFNAPLQVVVDEDATEALGKKYWRTQAGFKFFLDDPTYDRWVYIPAEYLTDGASVPKWFQWVLPPMGKYGQAAVVHDWLCEHLQIFVNGQPQAIDRAVADKAFKQGMIALNVPSWKRNLMYIAVRVYAKYKNITNKPETDPAKAVYEAAHPTMVILPA